jgi:hypothetical protein
MFAVAACLSAAMPVSESELVQTVAWRVMRPQASIEATDESNKRLPSERKNFVVAPGQVLTFRLHPDGPPFWLAVLDEPRSYVPLTGPADVVPYHTPTVPPGSKPIQRLVQPCKGDYEAPYWCGEAFLITMSPDGR